MLLWQPTLALSTEYYNMIGWSFHFVLNGDKKLSDQYIHIFLFLPRQGPAWRKMCSKKYLLKIKNGMLQKQKNNFIWKDKY